LANNKNIRYLRVKFVKFVFFVYGRIEILGIEFIFFPNVSLLKKATSLAKVISKRIFIITQTKLDI